MYNLVNEFNKCKAMLDDINVPYNKGVTVEVNTRAHKRYGQTKRNCGKYSININADLLNEKNPVSALHNTILHELLHTCPDCMNHGENWKKWGFVVNRHYGVNVKRTSSQEEKGLVVFQTPKHKIGYVLTCNSCGEQFRYHRAGKAVKNPENFRCSCGGGLKCEKIIF